MIRDNVAPLLQGNRGTEYNPPRSLPSSKLNVSRGTHCLADGDVSRGTHRLGAPLANLHHQILQVTDGQAGDTGGLTDRRGCDALQLLPSLDGQRLHRLVRQISWQGDLVLPPQSVRPLPFSIQVPGVSLIHRRAVLRLGNVP